MSEKKLFLFVCPERKSASLCVSSVALVKVRVCGRIFLINHNVVLYDYRTPRVVSMAVCHFCGDSVCVVPTV